MSSPLCFVLLCGIPGAGKSTVARGLQAAAEADGDEGMGMRTTVVRIEVDTYMGEGSNTPEFSSEAWKVRQGIDVLMSKNFGIDVGP
jgi:broad-specificity NMP kinase